MSSSEHAAARTGLRLPAREASGEPTRAAGRIFLVAGLVLAGALAGCGFHLRGDVSYPFSSLYVNAPAAPQFAVEMKRTLQSAGQTRIAAAAGDAQAILDITGIVDDKSVLSLSSGGRVSEYLLTKRVSFNVHDAAGHDWLPAAEISIRRSYTFNESEVLARDLEEQRLLKEMQTDAVQQIVRRLQAAKKPAA